MVRISIRCLFGHAWRGTVTQWFPTKMSGGHTWPRASLSSMTSASYRTYVADVYRECQRCGRCQSGQLAKQYDKSCHNEWIMSKVREWE